MARHRGDIGRGDKWTWFGNVVACLFNIAGVFAFDWLWLQILSGVVAFAFMIECVYHIINIYKNPYDADKLLKDVEAMDRTERRSPIIAVRNATNNFKNRYLVYYDDGWKCDFFPNHRTAETQDADEKHIVEYLSDSFEIPADDFSITHVGADSKAKASAEHDNELRYYDYQFYKADVNRVPKAWKGDSFSVGSKRCRWMTLDEMLRDPNIEKKNHDVITYVKGNIA